MDLTVANAAFYEVFEAGDLERMDAAWVHDDRVWCTHPGTDTVVGWKQVRGSWAAIFATSAFMQFIVTDVTCHSNDGIGVVTCTEHILSGTGEELGDTRAVATNVYQRTGDGWRMLGHHASPILRAQVTLGPFGRHRPGGPVEGG